MFERFTKAARTAVVRAQEEAREQGSPTIGAAHLLFGVLTDTDGAPATVLRRWDVSAASLAAAAGGADLDDEALSALGIDLDEVRRRTEDAFGPGALDRPRWGRGMAKGHIPFTPEAKASLGEAVRAAVRGSVHEIGSAQLFLGLLAVEDGTAVRTLRRLGVTASAEELRRLVQAELDQAA
jgi:ATP-dependent Clp protease ATP-binding subunit ClpA